MGKDYYAVLGISKDATRDEIKKAYKSLAKKYHPDINKSPGASEQFKEINEAASVLADDAKKAQYDRYGSEGFQAGNDFSGYAQGFDFDEIFESFFGGFGRSQRTGSDLRYDIEITLLDASKGIEKEVSIRHRKSCSHCKGQGGSHPRTCTTCHGTGRTRQTRQTPFGVFSTTGVCQSCNGGGKIFDQPCDDCDGTGIMMGSSKLKISIPAGIENGTRLRVAGAGDAGVRGSQGGDLYVFVSVSDHEVFERQGNDIHLEVPISYTQAALGDEIEVPTLSGKALLKIPSGTQAGTVFRLKGKGMPSLHGGVGDELVHAIIEIPKKLSKKERELLEQLSTLAGDHGKPYKNLLKKIFGG